MANTKCKRSSTKKVRCVKCLSLIEELLKLEDVSDDEVNRLQKIKSLLERGRIISEARVNYIYDLWEKYQ